ncbi:MAG TPA: hypothetical protein VNA89_13945 [Gemmatimonadaceae bacterium]|nr:hypothetical protein [Gemmatimonadaceae bacterium]
MQIVLKVFAVGYSVIAAVFFVCGLALLTFAGLELWRGVAPGGTLPLRDRFDAVLEAVGLLTISVAALGLGQTVVEEEVQREAHVSSPTRVRRFLSRFLIVVVVALAVETLVAVFRLTRDDPSRLPQAAAVGVAAAALLAAWGVFVRLNRSAEELEPEAMARAKSEDREVEGSSGRR